MNSIPISRAASALLRALLDRAAAERDRILLTEIQSREWQSLTFTGERHVIQLRVVGAHAEFTARLLTAGLEEAEFAIPGQIVADITANKPICDCDGALTLTIEALTIAE